MHCALCFGSLGLPFLRGCRPADEKPHVKLNPGLLLCQVNAKHPRLYHAWNTWDFTWQMSFVSEFLTPIICIGYPMFMYRIPCGNSYFVGRGSLAMLPLVYSFVLGCPRPACSAAGKLCRRTPRSQMIYSAVLKTDEEAGGRLDTLGVSAGQETDEVCTPPLLSISSASPPRGGVLVLF